MLDYGLALFASGTTHPALRGSITHLSYRIIMAAKVFIHGGSQNNGSEIVYCSELRFSRQYVFLLQPSGI
jgi:hypothetical protein